MLLPPHSLSLFSWDSNDVYVRLFDVPHLLNALFWLFNFYFNLDHFYWPIFKFTDYFLSCVESTNKPEVTRLSHSSSLLLCLWFLVFPFAFYPSAEITYLLLPIVFYLFFRVFKIINQLWDYFFPSACFEFNLFFRFVKWKHSLNLSLMIAFAFRPNFFLFLCLLIVDNSQICCIGQLILREIYFMLRDEDTFPSTGPLMWWFVLILSWVQLGLKFTVAMVPLSESCYFGDTVCQM